MASAKKKSKAAPKKKPAPKKAPAPKKVVAKKPPAATKPSGLPKALAALLEKHRGRTTPLIYKGAVPMFAADQEVQFDPDGAAARFEDDETKKQSKGEVPIGYFSGLVLVVDVGNAKLPVTVYLEGRPVSVAKTLDAFVKNLAEIKETPGPKAGTKLLEPKTVAGYRIDWPKSPYYFVIDTQSMSPQNKHNPFLWIELRGKNYDLYVSHMMDEGKSVAKEWQSKTEKYDRGSGDFVDVAWYRGAYASPVVTPVVRAMCERLPMTGVEFLPHRVSVKGAKADYFFVHTTRMLDCLDLKACDPTWDDKPRKLVFKPGSIPDDAHLFRIATYPRALFASAAFVDLFRDANLSGLDFVPLAEWSHDMTR